MNVTVSSMTAFARVEGENALGSYAWELRSVNHRYLEAQFKLPEKLRSLEPQLREGLRGVITRGKVECSLYFKSSDVEARYVINEDKVTALLEAAQLVGKLAGQSAQSGEQGNTESTISVSEIMQWPGVMQASEINIEQLSGLLMESFGQALEKLQQARLSEGARMAQLIYERLDQIDQISAGLREHMPQLLDDYQQRIEERLQQMQVELDHDRLAQEMVMLAQKTDVAEELDRLDSHTTEVRDTLQKNEPCGRRLDFLMQELNREANTLGSKSIATENSQGAVNLKVLIEQMREQVQNIE